ncbi:unnamed protein product [Hymenolepis diminuta]|uniref:Uncharacterized protein n=1 Tax=Hymenolepis diminuta TaxID=6216 RepID=A0A3P6W353_HYMDI|nr:unnamed protein product [Hymenolepis diminuta]
MRTSISFASHNCGDDVGDWSLPSIGSFKSSIWGRRYNGGISEQISCSTCRRKNDARTQGSVSSSHTYVTKSGVQGCRSLNFLLIRFLLYICLV